MIKRDELMNVLTLAAVGVGLYLAYKGVKAVGSVVGAVGNAAQAAGDGLATGVSAIGDVFGLPSANQTISNPAQVRWIIDNVGSYQASRWGAAAAYVTALGMPAGSGSGNPPPDYVLRELGISVNTSVPNTQQQVVDFITGGRDYSGSMLGGPSFSGYASGNVSTNPYYWYQ
ncbi:MAG: hypothetical protein WAQ08_05875 [Aquabacterium sp.]|uniref:hypothetical protein n=1 Tax=Aquabacterium sp. TaxID=1872578 RepID=UPI003BB15DE8